MTLIDLPEPNIPLLRKAVEWAEAEAAKTDGTGLWNQAAYAVATDCGTAFCIAGWTVANAAEDVTVGPYPTGYGTEAGELQQAIHDNGKPVVWESEAASLLGLTDGEAWDLFNVDNDIHTVRRLAESIAARVGERL
jgi:hypothetical protein